MKTFKNIAVDDQENEDYIEQFSNNSDYKSDMDAISLSLENLKIQFCNSSEPNFRSNWVLWHLSSDKSKFWNDRLERIACVTSINELLIANDRVQDSNEYYFFKESIRPSWDDSRNSNGGRLVVTVLHPNLNHKQESIRRKRTSGEIWLRLIVSLGQEKFGKYNEQVCGAVLIMKRNKNVIALWTKDAANTSAIRSMSASFKKLLKIKDEVEYEKHPNFDSNKHVSPLLMIYGLDIENFNCDKVFNLLSPFGDCLKVKFLKPESNTCMVEMRSSSDTFYVIQNLTGLWLYGKAVQFSSSHQPFVHLYPPKKPFMLPDDTFAYKDFSKSRNLRFRTPELAAKNKLVSPTSQLYFFGAPLSVTEDHIRDIFEIHNLEPRKVIFFNKNNNSKKGNLMGIIFFYAVDEAIEGLITCNHTQFVGLHPAPKFPQLLKLSFAPRSESEQEEEGEVFENIAERLY